MPTNNKIKRLKKSNGINHKSLLDFIVYNSIEANKEVDSKNQLENNSREAEESRTNSKFNYSRGISDKVEKVEENIDHLEEKNTNPLYPPVKDTPIQKLSEDNYMPNIEEKSSELEEDKENSVVFDAKNQVIILNAKNRKAFIYFEKVEDTKVDVNLAKDGKIPVYPVYELILKRARRPEAKTLRIKLIWRRNEKGNVEWHIENYGAVVNQIYEFLSSSKKDKHITKDMVKLALDYLINEIPHEPKEVDIVDYVQSDPELRQLFNELKRNPIKFVLDHTDNIVGNEELKIKILYAVVSSVLPPLEQSIYRIHLIINGNFGVGKSSTVESVLNLFFNNADGFSDYIVYKATRFTRNALGHLDVDNLDGKVFYLVQMDYAEGVNYLREALDMGYLITIYPCRDSNTGEIKQCENIIKGMPVFISTNVSANLDDQLLSRVLQLYLPRKTDNETIHKVFIKKVTKPKRKVDITKIKLVTYAWLKSLPKDVAIPENVAEKMWEFYARYFNLEKIKKDEINNIFRPIDHFRNLVHVHALIHGHDVVRENDVDEVISLFKKDLILSAFLLSELDLKIMKFLRDIGAVEEENGKTPHMVRTLVVASEFKMYVRSMKNILDRLANNGLLIKELEEGRTSLWCLSRYGLNVVNDLLEGEQQQESEAKPWENFFQPPEEKYDYIVSKIADKPEWTVEELRTMLQQHAEANTDDLVNKWIKLLEETKVIRKISENKYKALVKWKAIDSETKELVYEEEESCEAYDGQPYDENNKVMRLCLSIGNAYIENTEDGKRIFRVIK
ncbi:hypothetical protein [Sulfurisphaera javensis]